MIDNALTPYAALLSGAASFFSPCVLPLLPALATYVAGVSLERRQLAAGAGLRVALLIHLAAFLAGFSVVLMGLAAASTFVGGLLLSSQRFLMAAGGVFIAVQGLLMTGLAPKYRGQDLRVRFRNKWPGFLGSGAAGATYGFVWSPCVGPVLGSLILLTGSPEVMGHGLLLLLLHCAGFSVPFIFAGVLLDGFFQAFARKLRLIALVQGAAGLTLAAVGVLIASGKFLGATDSLFQACGGWVEFLIQWGL